MPPTRYGRTSIRPSFLFAQNDFLVTDPTWMPTPHEITIELYADTRGTGRCKSCHATLQWAVVVDSGARMPFDDARFTVISTRKDEDGRLVERADRSTNHWATCPGAPLFKKTARTRRP